jgi:hypothetical protein
MRPTQGLEPCLDGGFEQGRDNQRARVEHMPNNPSPQAQQGGNIFTYPADGGG